MKKMKTIYLAVVSLLLITACDNDLDQSPPLLLESSALEEFGPVFECSVLLSDRWFKLHWV